MEKCKRCKKKDGIGYAKLTDSESHDEYDEWLCESCLKWYAGVEQTNVGWKLCKEELPKEDEWVLIYVVEIDVMYAAYLRTGKEYNGYEFKYFSTSGSKFTLNRNNIFWMPLPEKPV